MAVDPKSPVVARVTQKFAQPPEAVFDAWLKPEVIGQWMFGINVREEEVVHLKTNAILGGSFSFLVRRNGQPIDHTGKYLVIQRPHRLAFTWGVGNGDTSIVRISIDPDGKGSKLDLAHELHPAWADYLERTQSGWTKMLGVLAKLIG